jgi:hypothetical protein
VAALGYLDTILNALDATIRVPIKSAFEYVTRELALGDNTKAENFSWYRVTGTTHATANTEFSILHGMDHAPSKLIPVVQLDAAGGQLVPLTVSRVSDSKRVYLKSSSTGAAFIAFLE